MSKLNLTPEQATKEIKAVKQSNKVAREKRAKLRGYASSELYLKALQAIVDGKVESPSSSKSTPKAKKTSKTGKETKILVIDVIDTSGSMGSNKYVNSRISAANTGINQGLISLREDEAKLGVTYNHILVEFDTTVTVGELQSVQSVKPINLNGNGGTALNDAIIKAINVASVSKAKDEKALINIYTDGDENSSRHSKFDAQKAIRSAEKFNVVVTFIGTDYDTKTAIQNYGLHQSNTLVYDGTAKGMSMSMQETSSARSAFSKKIVDGEDVSTGFYKKIVK